MKVTLADLSNCGEARGVVVVIDVLRAFTTAAFAFAAGAAEILPVATVDEALRLRAAGRADLAMGEVDGLPVADFDLSNSPAALVGARLDGARIAFRTTHGTQGVDRSAKAAQLLVGSFVVARATVGAVLDLAPRSVTLVITGSGADAGAEDRACADYLAALLHGQAPNPEPYLQRAASSWTARRFLDPAQAGFPPADLPLCLDLDRFPLVMRLSAHNGVRVIRTVGRLTPAQYGNHEGAGP